MLLFQSFLIKNAWNGFRVIHCAGHLFFVDVVVSWLMFGVVFLFISSFFIIFYQFVYLFVSPSFF